MELCQSSGIKTEMIYTGQTGWMQGSKYGIIFDSILNDFVCGELEHAIVKCDEEAMPDLMIIEGQSALRNPAGPCGSELLLSAGAKGVILQHAPGRKYVEGYEDLKVLCPDVDSEVHLIQSYGCRVLAITLSREGMQENQLKEVQQTLEARHQVPVIRPIEEGLERALSPIREYISTQTE